MIQRFQLQDAIDSAIALAEVKGEVAAALQRVGREAHTIVVGDYYDRDGNLCPASQAVPTESKVPSGDGLFNFALEFDHIMRPLVGAGTHRVAGITREQRDARLLWATTVEATNRPQIQAQLAENGGRCCLGVLCDLGVAMGVIDDYEPANGMPTKAVTEWVGLSEYSRIGDEQDLNAAVTYAALNDGGSSFKQIAEKIRQSVA